MKALAAKFGKKDSGLPNGLRDDALYCQEEEEEEDGLWHYLVIDKDGIEPRRVASFEKEFKAEGHYKEGSVHAVTRRLRRGWTYWLLLRDQPEWVFDVSPADKSLCMVEVAVEEGTWDYTALTVSEVLARPSYEAPLSAGARGQRRSSASGAPPLQQDEVFCVVKRVATTGGWQRFLEISNGRGWVSEYVDGARAVCLRTISTADALPGTNQASEMGAWDYIVIDSTSAISLLDGPLLRANPVRRDPPLQEGDTLRAYERVSTEWSATLLRTETSWVCDTAWAPKPRRVMMQVAVERGSWLYRIVSPMGVAIRSRCSFAQSAKSEYGPNCGEFVRISERVRVGETAFLRIQDTDGWIFDVKNGAAVCTIVDVDDGNPAPSFADQSTFVGSGGDMDAFTLDMVTPRPGGQRE